MEHARRVLHFARPVEFLELECATPIVVSKVLWYWQALKTVQCVSQAVHIVALSILRNVKVAAIVIISIITVFVPLVPSNV
jgi:hypothetical protein